MEDNSYKVNLNEEQLDLLVNVIGFAQSDKKQFQKYMSMMFGKDYSNEEIKNILEQLRISVKSQSFKYV